MRIKPTELKARLTTQYRLELAVAIRALGKPEHVLYDLKYQLPAADNDLRL